MKQKITKYDIFIIIVIILIIAVVVGISIYIILHPKREVNELIKVNDYSTYFMVINTINKYFENISMENNEVVYDVLDKNYTEKYNIKENNINYYIFNYGSDVSIRADTVSSFKIGDNTAYYVQGSLEQAKYEQSPKVVADDYAIILFVDIKNLTYSLYPTTKEEYKEVLSTIPSISIVQNENNSYEGVTSIDDETMCVVYLNDFVSKLDNNVESTYSLISSDTKEKLDTLEKYQEYVNTELKDRTTVADKCAITENDIVKNFIIYDKNNNYYEFIETGIMEYYVNFKIASDEE